MTARANSGLGKRGPVLTAGTLDNPQEARLSVKERMALGKQLRATVPRRSHGEYAPPAPRDPMSILEEQAKSRLKQLVPIRYARMLESSFAFLRGSAAVMAGDLAATPTTGITVQACGDAHVANFGVFASAERNLIFGINDFDETLPAPWEWDLKRLAASAVVCARHLGGDAEDCEAAARAAVKAYRTRMREYAEMGHLQVFDRCGVCGWALALAHAKAGDPAMIAGYVGKGEALDEAIARFAVAYADQTERDHAALLKAAPKSAQA